MMDAKTRLFCLIGDPVEHSLSPAIHNAVFKKLDLNCAYAACRVKREDLANAISGLRGLGIAGANVTIPHKVAVVRMLDAISDEARIIGAVNTIKCNGGLTGYNTDGMGALRALRKGGADPKGKRVLMLGSGGAARAIAVTLGLRGNPGSLTILGIDMRELGKLARDVAKGTGLRAIGARLDEKTLRDELQGADLLINCTPVGMHPKVNETLVTADMLREDIDVMDIVYNPLETKLLREAKKAGVRHAIGGLEMFVNQGAEALRIWLGIEPPVDLMRRTALKGLKKH